MTSIVGKIKSITLNNFITYDSIKLCPGDFLNVIIGPNGTGKSTIVAAIIIGMGGSCKTLSRSRVLSEYIKNGCDKAAILIEIYKNENRDFLKFYRRFDLAGHNVFKIDENKMSEKEYIKYVAKLNIQVDNLCQFLPQDRVQDFTKMNPQEILINTQKSVCDPKVVENWEKLIAMEISQKHSGKNLADIMAQLKEAEQKNEQLKDVIDTIKQRKYLITENDVALVKKAWLQIKELKKQCKDIENDLKLAENACREHKQNLIPIEQEFKDIFNFKNKLTTEISQNADNITILTNELDKCEEITEQLEDDIQRVKSDFQQIKSRCEDRDNEIHTAESVLTIYTQDLKIAKEKIGPEHEKKAKLKKFCEKMNEIKQENSSLLQKRNHLGQTLDENFKPKIYTTRKKIEALANIDEQRLQALKNRYEHAYKGLMWVNENRHLFKGHVYGPMILEINLKDVAYAKYLENTIGMHDLVAFTCELSEDMTVLIKELTSKMHLKVNIVQSNPADELNFSPAIPIKNIKQYGFRNYLINMIDAPFPILNYLCKLYQIHNVPVGDDHSYNVAGDIIEQCGLRVFFTTNHRYQIITSKYSGEKSSTCSEIKSKNLLNTGVNIEQINGQKNILKDLVKKSDEIRNEITDLESKITYNEARYKEVADQKKKIENLDNDVAKCVQKVKIQHQKITSLKESVIDMDAEEVKYKINIKQILTKLWQYQTKKVETFHNFQKISLKNEFSRKVLFNFNKENTDLENRLNNARKMVQKGEEIVEQIKKTKEEHKQQSKEVEAKLHELTGGINPTSARYPYKKIFDKLPDNLPELQDQIDIILTKIECMQANDESIIEDFKKREELIENLRNTIDNSNQVQKQIDNDIIKIHNEWYPEIQRIIEIINKNFSGFLNSMGYAGEVEISRKGEQEYSEYGVVIRVKYRSKDKLQALGPHLQSGGERAVAIAVYTLALQHISKVPFRCVDEINQGMDPVNERKVFELLVDEMATSEGSQYFFITPKLLPNLKSNPNIAFHIIYNGPHLEGPLIFLHNSS